MKKNIVLDRSQYQPFKFGKLYSKELFSQLKEKLNSVTTDREECSYLIWKMITTQVFDVMGTKEPVNWFNINMGNEHRNKEFYEQCVRIAIISVMVRIPPLTKNLDMLLALYYVSPNDRMKTIYIARKIFQLNRKSFDESAPSLKMINEVIENPKYEIKKVGEHEEEWSFSS
jgi:hypothetical protein